MRSSLPKGFHGSTSMGMERMGRAGSVVLLFIPFRDGGHAPGYPLDEFTIINNSIVAANQRGFGDRERQEWMEDDVAVPPCYFPIKSEARGRRKLLPRGPPPQIQSPPENNVAVKSLYRPWAGMGSIHQVSVRLKLPDGNTKEDAGWLTSASFRPAKIRVRSGTSERPRATCSKPTFTRGWLPRRSRNAASPSPSRTAMTYDSLFMHK